ncbi:MAG: hypothetical protein OXC79_02630 [Candidatus Poribacteria bacterium]|nr:hypothetical protein [Candidatus Poribacteria bacterium]
MGDTLWRRADEIIGAFVVSKWEQISPVVPGKVLSLVVDRNRLYVATERRGIFHISLEEYDSSRTRSVIPIQQEAWLSWRCI